MAPGYCDATAGLTEEAPEGWDPSEDGEWQGEIMSVADRFPASSNGCGPLTPGLDARFVTTDRVWFTASSEAAMDLLDFAISQVAAVASLPAEALGSALLEGLHARPDPAASEPEGWDPSEDGPWEAPMLEAREITDLLAEVLTTGGPNASAVSEAYSFSSSPQAVRYRAGSPGEAPFFECNDFSRTGWTSSSSPPALVAELFVTDAGGGAKGGGGETVLPALGLQIQPKVGRLVLYETILPDGTCDPAGSLVEHSPLKPQATDLLVVRKTFHADRSFSRAQMNGEGPQRAAPKVECDALGVGMARECTRYEHVPALKGDAVMPMRQEMAMRRCLAANAAGPCGAPEGYSPPPPPPNKTKKKPEPPATPPPEAVPTPPSPPPPVEDDGTPRAPPPIVR